MQNTTMTIQRDASGLAFTSHCRETADGGIDIHHQDVLPYQLAPERTANGPAFAETLIELQSKRWFTPEIQCEVTNIVTARWLALARGWTPRRSNRWN